MNRRSIARCLFFALVAVSACAAGVDWPEASGSRSDALVVLPPPPANLVVDPGFELQSGTSLAAPWEGTGTIEHNETDPARGTHDVRIQADSGWTAVQQWIAVKPFNHYVATVAVESSDNLTDAYFSVRSGATWQVLQQVPFKSVGTTGYTPLRFEFDTGNDTSALVYVGMWPHAPATWMRIDDLTVLREPSVVANGSVESTTASWQVTGTGAIETSSPHTGSGALVLRGTSGWTSMNQWIPVKPNTRYRAGAWVKTSATAIDGYFSVRGATDFNVINQIPFGSLPGDYEWLTFDFDTGANQSVLLYAGFWGPNAPSFLAVDDVTVTDAAPLHGGYGIGNYAVLAATQAENIYGCDVDPSDARARIDTMVARFHVTDVQFYDWMPSYDSPTSGRSCTGDAEDLDECWLNAWDHSYPICRKTLEVYIDELHLVGARAWAYLQAQAADTVGLATPDSGFTALTDMHGQAYCMNENPFIGPCTDPTHHPIYLPNAAWAKREVSLWADGVAALKFDGIHWDTLQSFRNFGPGYPEETLNMQAFLNTAGPLLTTRPPPTGQLMQSMNFIDVNWWDPSLTSAVAFLYAESWNDEDRSNMYDAMTPFFSDGGLNGPASLDMESRSGVLPFYPFVPGANQVVPDGGLTLAQQVGNMESRWDDAREHNVRYLVIRNGNEWEGNTPKGAPAFTPDEVVALTK